jgi:hypothetical protein
MRKPADRLRQYLERSVAAYETSGSHTPRTVQEAFAALQPDYLPYEPGWFRVEVLVRFLDAPEIGAVLGRELQSEDIDRSFYAALLLALLGVADGLKLLEQPPTLSNSGIETGLALLARAALGKLDANELERSLNRVPNARAFGL